MADTRDLMNQWLHENGSFTIEEAHACNISDADVNVFLGYLLLNYLEVKDTRFFDGHKHGDKRIVFLKLQISIPDLTEERFNEVLGTVRNSVSIEENRWIVLKSLPIGAQYAPLQ